MGSFLSGYSKNVQDINLNIHIILESDFVYFVFTLGFSIFLTLWLAVVVCFCSLFRCSAFVVCFCCVLLWFAVVVCFGVLWWCALVVCLGGLLWWIE